MESMKGKEIFPQGGEGKRKYYFIFMKNERREKLNHKVLCKKM